jgi:hypothetical protein
MANWLLAIFCESATLGMYAMLDYQEQETEKRIAAAQAHLLMGGVITDKAQTVAVKCLQVMDVTL